MSATFLLTWCQEGKPHSIGWAHRDIYGEVYLKDIIWTNMTVKKCLLVLAHTKKWTLSIEMVWLNMSYLLLTQTV